MQQLTIEDWLGQDLWSGKTYPEHSAATEEKTSRPSSRKSSESKNQKPLMCLCLKKENGPTPGSYTMKWEDGLSHTDYMTRNFGECPNEGKESLWSLTLKGGQPQKSCLSNILETNPDPKYNLSPTACQGILNRAERRGKKLPDQLEKALKKQAGGGTYDVRISSDGTQNWRAHCYETEISRALDTGGENPDSNHGGVAITYGISAYDSNAMKSPNPNSGVYKADTARTLDNNGGSPACNQGGMAIIQGADLYNGALTGEASATVTAATGGTNTSGPKVVCLNDQGGSIMSTSENETATLRAQTHGHEPVVFENHCQDSRYNELGETCSTLATNLGTGGNNQPLVVKEPVCIGNGQADADHNTNSNSVCRIEASVRRLTPMECERLQGFPSGWTDIGEWIDSKGKKHKPADAPRYKALGNSIALPFWFWLLRRISATYTRQATLGSLFSGIGGFELCWELCNGAGTARWQSEIEPFCIALLKRRFGDDKTGEKGDAWKYLNS